MALVGVATGPRETVGDVVQTCEQSVYWTIRITNANVRGGNGAALGNRVFRMTLTGAEDRDVTTDVNGFITLVFTPGTNCVPLQATFLEQPNHWQGSAQQAAGGGTIFQSTAPLRWQYKLRVRARRGLALDSPTIHAAGLTFAGGIAGTLVDPATGAQGGAYSLDDLPGDQPLQVALTSPHSAAASRVGVRIGQGAQQTLTVDNTNYAADGGVYTRTGANALSIATPPHGAVVVVEILAQLQFRLTARVLQHNNDTAIAQAPLTLTGWAGVGPSRTGDAGQAFDFGDLNLDTDYVLSIPKSYANEFLSGATATVNGAPMNIAAANVDRTVGGITGRRTAENEIHLRATQSGVVAVTFRARFVWKLRALVHDATKGGNANALLPAAELPLKAAPLRLQGNGGDLNAITTAADGAAYAKNDLVLNQAYTLTVRDTWESITALDTATAEVNGNAVNIATANVAAAADHVTITRTAANAITIQATQGTPTVKITFQQQYRKVFIIGEGPAFPYAIGLAKRYGAGEAAGDRNNGLQPNGAAAATPLSATARKWIIASQYDVHAAPVNPPRNLCVWPNQFDVRDTNCWDAVNNARGPFDATVFNNPHPGYGMHRVTVFGLRDASQGAEAKYISVHSLGHDPKLNAGQVLIFRAIGNNAARDLPANQRVFLTGIGCARDGTGNLVSSFGDDGGVASFNIPNSFQALANGHIAFPLRETHYRTTRATRGLWESLLRCYRRNAPARLRGGHGSLYLHGSANFRNNLNVGLPLEGFAEIGNWAGGGAGANLLYANYNTNFTSDEFHPSWFAKVDFNPGEPSLANAICYRMDV